MAKLVARAIVLCVVSAAADTTAADDDYDAIIERTLARAAAVREARLVAYDRTDQGSANSGAPGGPHGPLGLAIA